MGDKTQCCSSKLISDSPLVRNKLGLNNSTVGIELHDEPLGVDAKESTLRTQPIDQVEVAKVPGWRRLTQQANHFSPRHSDQMVARKKIIDHAPARLKFGIDLDCVPPNRGVEALMAGASIFRKRCGSEEIKRPGPEVDDCGNGHKAE